MGKACLVSGSLSKLSLKSQNCRENRLMNAQVFFIPLSVFYLVIRVSSRHPCFISSSVFHLFIRVSSLHPCFISSSVFHLVSPSVFHSFIRVSSLQPCLKAVFHFNHNVSSKILKSKIPSIFYVSIFVVRQKVNL